MRFSMGRMRTTLAHSNWSLNEWQPCGPGLKWRDHFRGTEKHTANRVASPSHVQFWADEFRKRWLDGCRVLGFLPGWDSLWPFYVKNTWLLIQRWCHAPSFRMPPALPTRAWHWRRRTQCQPGLLPSPPLCNIFSSSAWIPIWFFSWNWGPVNIPKCVLVLTILYHTFFAWWRSQC